MTTITRIIIHKIGESYHVDAMVDGRHAQAAFKNPASARQASIDLIQLFGDSAIQGVNPAGVLQAYKERA